MGYSWDDYEEYARTLHDAYRKNSDPYWSQLSNKEKERFCFAARALLLKLAKE